MRSIAKTEKEQLVLDLAEKALLSQGFRPVDVDCKVGPHSLLRLFIERSDRAVSIDDCRVATETLSPLLEEGIINGPFDLEVSSPGLDARLRLPSDFEKAVGGEVKMALVNKVEGFGANVRGELLRVEEDGVVVKVGGRPENKFLFENIKQANKIWKFK